MDGNTTDAPAHDSKRGARLPLRRVVDLGLGGALDAKRRRVILTAGRWFIVRAGHERDRIALYVVVVFGALSRALANKALVCASLAAALAMQALHKDQHAGGGGRSPQPRHEGGVAAALANALADVEEGAGVSQGERDGPHQKLGACAGACSAKYYLR